MQIHHDREIEPALPGADVGDVGHPGAIGRAHRELAVQAIGVEDRRPSCDVTVVLIAPDRSYFVASHDSRDAMLSAGLTRFPQIAEHAR